MHSMKLLAFTLFAYFVVVPLIAVAALLLLACGAVAAGGFAYGAFSLVGWFVIGDANALKAARFGFGYGMAAFALIVLFWDRVWELAVTGGARRDARFND